MAIHTMQVVSRFLFYFITSFAIAISGYFLLSAFLFHNRVFASWFRMFPYHDQQPVPYTIIPCFVYSCIATVTVKLFNNLNLIKQIGLTALIVFLTIIFSSPLGGMLYYYHDMKAGYFPKNWISKMISSGVSDGLGIGWLIIALSIPYNVLGIVVCYFITKTGSRIFYKI